MSVEFLRSCRVRGPPDQGSLMKQRPTRTLALAVLAALICPLAAAAQPPERINVNSLKSSPTHSRFVVKYRAGTGERNDNGMLQRSLNSAASSTLLQIAPTGAGRTKAAAALSLKRNKRMGIGADVITTNRPLDRVEAEALMRQIAANPNVEYVEADRKMQLFMTPNDPRFSEQYGYGTGNGGIRATQAWDLTTGAGVVVGVVDSGVNRHPDLVANLLPGYDFSENDTDVSDPTSINGFHGTHVAGTIAAVTNNGIGVAGTAPGAKILPVRVFNASTAENSVILDGLVWAVGGTVPGAPVNTTPAEVVNMSLGSVDPETCDNATKDALALAEQRGAIVVVAAGNNNADASLRTMTNCGKVISVGSVTSTGARSSFSNWGTLVDIAAPGSSILSTVNGFNGNASYGLLSGTSMATPHVAGVVALVQSIAPTPLTGEQMRTLLKNTSRPFPVTPDRAIGAGIVNAFAAVSAAGGGAPGNNAPVANFSSTASGLTVSFADSSSDSDGSIVSRSWNFGDGSTSTAASPSKTYSAAGTYTVTLTVTDDDGATNTKTATVTVGSGGAQTYSNATDYAIRDNATVDSPIVVSGRSGNAPSNASVTVAIVHTYQGDLKVDLVAPDGSLYNIHNRTGASTDNINKTVTLNLSSEALNGTWKLRVNDGGFGDTGKIDSWSVTF
ncbi:MAG: S8 family serine peptidase [Lysobacter sp.]|nr:S8 family serine peptidase [Lysobacter sp.]